MNLFAKTCFGSVPFEAVVMGHIGHFNHISNFDLQCFDAVCWATGRASGHKKLSHEVLALLSVWSEVQTCIWLSIGFFLSCTGSPG